ncbi:shikimate dehydrogenase [Motilibacter rhizosphaerae]|uniref:Shikimate dehydrogenase n=1 Tax=Motilibacter rhizosphaerae TaxID=598652 RepID=A0A4Q7NQU4_9ACTN|nr:shikimate dehydrogenase [Motilibacter rhizosphaerae]RZS89423.1 shikimate dehydrogenase [Motilibacter rhizosphaerae]
MRAAVLGRPVAHSLSPVLHRAAYAVLGLADWSYDAVEVGEEGLADLVGGLGPEWVGLSLTMPLKRAVLPLLDARDEVVDATGAANTLVLRDGRRVGANTDVPGLVAALAERGVRRTERPLVLGGGATAASALVALGRLGARQVTLVVRRPQAADELSAVARAAGVTTSVVPWEPERAAVAMAAADLVVSTAPAGATDGLVDALPPLVSGVLFDVVYAPWPTPLAVSWLQHGEDVLGGLDLLVHQAALQVVLMTGTATPAAELVAPMRAAGEAALAAA